MADDPLQQVSVSTRRRVRWVFGGFAGLLLVQYLLLGVAGEPYPALMFPGFGGVSRTSQGQQVRRVTVKFLREGRIVHTCSKGELFQKIPGSYHLAILGTVCFPTELQDTARYTKTGMIRLVCQLFPGYRLAHRNHLAGKDDSLRRWLNGRARKLVPDTPVDEVVIDTGLVTYDLSQLPPVAVEEIHVGALSLGLEGGVDGPTRIASH